MRLQVLTLALLATVANPDTFDITFNKLIARFFESETALDSKYSEPAT